MIFPNTRRIIYQKNPLERVICQLRFPTILKIETDIPANFQELIRSDFPNYIETNELKFEMQLPPKELLLPDFISKTPKSSYSKNHEFSSEDGIWKLNLTRNFLALSTSKYERREKFQEKLKIAFDSLLKVYSPNYFTRIGLRYIDVINRTTLNLEGVGWEELLQPYILGILGESSIGNRVKNFECVYEINLDESFKQLRMLTKFIDDEESTERYFLIDSDFFKNDKTDTNDTFQVLDYLSIQASRLIQWCITPKLHKAMEPIEL